MKISGSQAIIQSLLNEKVEIIFGYPGGANMPIYDALYDFEKQKKIKHILVRHEQGASHAAEGYAQMTDKAGVCLVTSGPGATNLVTGIADAMMDSQPIVCITGQVVAGVIGTDAFQEADVIGITTPITKWNYQITRAAEIPKVFAQAFHIAQTGRPGPVVIDITKNAQFEEFEFVYPKSVSISSFQPTTKPNPIPIKKAAQLLNQAKRPLILAGHGISISRAQQQLQQLSTKGNIPVALTLWGLSNLPRNFANYVGMLGMHGNYGPNVLSNKADVVMAVGMRFDDRVTGDLNRYLPEAKVIHIDIDPAELNKNVQAEVPIVADARQALNSMIPHINKKKHAAWFAQFNQCQQQEYKQIIHKQTEPLDGEITMSEVIHQVSEITKGKAIMVSDVGQHQMETARYYQFDRPNNFIVSGGLGTMGFGLPAAIGAKFACPDELVISISGDGSFQMTIQELGTIKQEQLPVKMLVLNNEYLGMVRQWQELFFDKRYAATPMISPDFVQVAQAYDIESARISKRSQLRRAIKKWLTSDKASLLEVKVKKQSNVFPMVPSGASVEEVRLE